MRIRPNVFGLIALVAALAVLGGAWYLVSHLTQRVCPFSGRRIYPQTRAVVRIGGKRYETCCVRCAIVEARQTGKPLRVLRVADFETRRFLDPAKAWFVEGSDVNFCMSMTPAVESPGRQSVYIRAFDRCAPSALAFSSEEQARAFIAQHGGAVKRLDDLQREATAPEGQRP